MKKFLSAFLALCLAFSLIACGNPTNAVEDNTSASTVSEISTELSISDVVVEEIVNEETTVDKSVVYPVTVTDQAGREVVIEKQPETLVSGYYISSSLLIALELDDKMVGIEAKAQKRPIYKLAAKNLIDLPNVGSAKEFDLEGCASLNADLVILPLKLKDAAATLDELGIKTILVNPESNELLLEMIDIISTATNTVERADELKNCISNQKDMLVDKLGNLDACSVYLAGNSNVLSTAGNKMYQSKMIELAGGKNVAEEIEDKYWVDVDYEQILAWNPEYIIIASEADYNVEDVLADEALKSCDAVKNENVYKIPSNAEAWDSPVPSGILGSVWLASILHSDVISSDVRDSIIEEFYEKFYGFTYEK